MYHTCQVSWSWQTDTELNTLCSECERRWLFSADFEASTTLSTVYGVFRVRLLWPPKCQLFILPSAHTPTAAVSENQEYHKQVLWCAAKGNERWGEQSSLRSDCVHCPGAGRKRRGGGGLDCSPSVRKQVMCWLVELEDFWRDGVARAGQTWHEHVFLQLHRFAPAFKCISTCNISDLTTRMYCIYLHATDALLPHNWLIG